MWNKNNKNSIYKFVNYLDIDINELILFGKSNINGRARLCIHKNNFNFFQSMIIYHDNRTILPIHRHLKTTEDLILLHGSLEYFVYDDDFNITKKIELNADSELNGVTTLKNTWHNIKIISDFIIFLENVKGSYEKNITEIRNI